MVGHRSHPEFSLERFFHFLTRIGGEENLKKLIESYNPPHRKTKRALAEEYGVEEAYLSSHLSNCMEIGTFLREEAEEALKYQRGLQETQDERIGTVKARIFYLTPRSDEDQEEAGQ